MKTFSTLALAFLLCCTASAQIRKADFAHTKKADRLFDKWEYFEAAKLYEDAVKQNPSPELYYRLGLCYQKMFRFEDAAAAYDKVNASGTFSDPSFYLNYGLVLKANERYTEAREAFVKYENLAPNDARGPLYVNSCDVVMQDLQKPVPVSITNLPMNTSDAAFCPVTYKDGMVFASNAPASTGDKTFAWNGKGYLDLFYAKKGSSDTQFDNTNPFNAGKINDKYHDGPATFTKNYDTIYFNRVSRELKGEKKRTLGVERSKIYSARMVDGEWTDIQPFVYNSDSFGVFTPFITPDGSRMYFASDMPGGMGETDIYYCERQGKGWSKPVNVGANVNTFGREQFPSLDAEGNLYFSSDAYMGYGGLDICVAKLINGIFQKAQVLKAPLNSAGNDYGISFIKSQQSGYLSSSRKGGQGDADIYYFNLEKDSLPCEVSTTSYVIGYECNPKKKEEIVVQPVDSSRLFASMRPKIDNSNIERIVVLPIYFDFDKSNIRPDAARNLDTVITIMHQHPDWNVQVNGHADSRGSSEYNLALSQRRANATVNYLSGKGIASSRMHAQGFGESKLLNRCADGVFCTESEHQVNRRVEFVFTTPQQKLSTN